MRANRFEDCSIHVLRVDGADDAGYFELDWKRDQTNTVKNVEILYFGLIPKYIGQKIGPWFLNQCLKTIREREPQARIWVHTCNWDHEKALATYKKAGFKQYKEEVEPITVPPGYVHPSQLQTQVQS